MEKPFFDEALVLAQGYKPIRDKLVEPIKPLKVDTSNPFNVLTLLSAQVQIPVRGAERSGTLYCYATRESLDDEFVFSPREKIRFDRFSLFSWRVDKLEFKANNQPNRFLFYDRSLRRVPTPSEQALIDYKQELQEKIARGLPSTSKS